jgi:phosphonate transport system ATP-binding protein
MHGAQARSDDPRLWFRATSPAWLRAEAHAALRSVGMAELAERRADRLSGGESQRVAIARALVQRPRVLFADEPVASLDPRVASEVMELLIARVRELGLTLVFVSHDIRSSLAHANRVLGLRAGKIELDAPAAELSPAHLRSFYD